MATIPEGSCTVVNLTGILQPVNSAQINNRWFIRDNVGGATLANGTFPGGADSTANGWAVSGNPASPLVCPPLGAKRTAQYQIFLDMSGGLSIGQSATNYQGVFNVGDAIAPCARPAPPIFTAATQGANIKLTGTG